MVAVERRRLDSFINMTLRVQPRFQQNPSEYYYPGLAPVEFYERSEFPWLEEFEAQTDAVRAELAQALHESQADFTPYIHYGEHMPLDQWRELNNSPRWTSPRPVPASCWCGSTRRGCAIPTCP